MDRSSGQPSHTPGKAYTHSVTPEHSWSELAHWPTFLAPLLCMTRVTGNLYSLLHHAWIKTEKCFAEPDTGNYSEHREMLRLWVRHSY